jgi:hypothetical protein
MQRAHGVGLLVGKVRWEPLAAVRVNPVSKALYDLMARSDSIDYGS